MFTLNMFIYYYIIELILHLLLMAYYNLNIVFGAHVYTHCHIKIHIILLNQHKLKNMSLHNIYNIYL